MWPFTPRKYKSLSHAVLAGDLRAVRKLLEQGADPNKCDPDDDAYPIHYALSQGAALVQLLIDYGADVNIPGRGKMPLAVADVQGYAEVASIFRRTGARVHTGDEEFSMDPRTRLQLEPQINELINKARLIYPTSPEHLADLVADRFILTFPKNMPFQEQEKIQKDVHALIRKKCGVKDYLDHDT